MMIGSLRSNQRPKALVAGMTVLAAAGAASLTVLAAACGASEPEVEPQRYRLRGDVVSEDVERRTITVAHEEIEGFMDAMTMPLNVRDDWVFDSAEPGSRIQATLVVHELESWLEDVVLVKPPAEGTAAQAVIAAADAGEPVPDLVLVDQDGADLHLADLAGRPYAFTFIYTRCPLPDFCPRMSEHFARAFARIEAEPERYGDAALVSISIDPDFDTPEVLRAYGERYLQERAPAGFARWRFATAPAPALTGLAELAGIRYMPDGSQFTHSLRTVVVDEAGRVIETLVGNAWSPAELLRVLEEHVGGGASEDSSEDSSEGASGEVGR